MALASLKPSSKAVTALIIIAVLLFFGCVLVYLAAAGRMRSIDAELADKKKQVAEATDMAQKLEQSRLNYLDAEAQLRFLECSVSTQAYVPTMLKQLETLGKSVDLKVLGIRPQFVQPKNQTRKLTSGKQAAEGQVDAAAENAKGTDESAQQKAPVTPYEELKVELELEGKYMNALDFLYKLTSFPKIIAVNSVQMSPVRCTDAQVSPTLNIKLNITAFVLKEDGESSKPETAASVGKVMGEGGNANGAG